MCVNGCRWTINGLRFSKSIAIVCLGPILTDVTYILFSRLSTGQTSKFIVNTVNAGSGALSVTVEGPSKVKLECREVEDGYEFSYTPTAPGDYFITIKYAGTNIAGSPYKARVEGQ